MSKSVPITQTQLEEINKILKSMSTSESMSCTGRSIIPLQQDGCFVHHHYTEECNEAFKLILVKKNTVSTYFVMYLESDVLDLELFNSVVQSATNVLQRCGFKLKSKHNEEIKPIQASIMIETGHGCRIEWVVQDHQRTQAIFLEEGVYAESSPEIFLTGCPNSLDAVKDNTAAQLSKFFRIRNAKNQLYKDQGLAYSLILAAKFFVPNHHFELVKEVSPCPPNTTCPAMKP